MSTKKKPTEEAAVDELRSDIAETRAELGDTVEALAAKTDVKERVEGSVRRGPGTWSLAVTALIAAVTAIGVLRWRRSRTR